MNRQSTIIRTAKTNDYADCLPLFETLYHGDIGPNFKQTFENFVNNDNGSVLLAEQFNKVIGVLVGSYHLDIDWEGYTAKVDALIVDKTFRKQGIGKRLMCHFITTAKGKKCRAVKSRINRKNVAAQKFHRSLGFTEAETYEYFLDFEETEENQEA